MIRPLVIAAAALALACGAALALAGGSTASAMFARVTDPLVPALAPIGTRPVDPPQSDDVDFTPAQRAALRASEGPSLDPATRLSTRALAVPELGPARVLGPDPRSPIRSTRPLQRPFHLTGPGAPLALPEPREARDVAEPAPLPQPGLPPRPSEPPTKDVWAVGVYR